MTHTEADDIEYDKTSSVHALTLIRQVKMYEVLYNKQLHEYADTARKEEIWDHIHKALFPNYELLSEDTKGVIRKTVRKRWKSLRDALVKDHRLRIEDPAQRLKKQNPQVKEMQFLIPFIKTPRFRDSSDNYDDGDHSSDFCKLMNESTIDLTAHEEPEDVNVQIDDDDMISNEALYPSVRLTTSESESGEVEWKNGFCASTSTEFKENHINYTIQEVEEQEADLQSEFHQQEESYMQQQKRRRTDSDAELHSKVVELVERCNTESHDEDRMFLLSLLSDFKRVPVEKKLKVKSAFVKALADALE